MDYYATSEARMRGALTVTRKAQTLVIKYPLKIQRKLWNAMYFQSQNSTVGFRLFLSWESVRSNGVRKKCRFTRLSTFDVNADCRWEIKRVRACKCTRDYLVSVTSPVQTSEFPEEFLIRSVTASRIQWLHCDHAHCSQSSAGVMIVHRQRYHWDMEANSILGFAVIGVG